MYVKWYRRPVSTAASSHIFQRERMLVCRIHCCTGTYSMHKLSIDFKLISGDFNIIFRTFPCAILQDPTPKPQRKMSPSFDSYSLVINGTL